MQYVYGALLLHSAKQEISEDAVKKVLQAAGVKTEDAKVKALVASLKDVNIEDAIKQAAAFQAAPAASSAPAAGGKGEAKKEEKKEEGKTEEEAAAGLSSLFG